MHPESAIAPPTMQEIEMMKAHQILISTLQMATIKAEYMHALIQKKITALSFEPLRDEGGSLSVVRAMSEIVGATSILIATPPPATPIHGRIRLMTARLDSTTITKIWPMRDYLPGQPIVDLVKGTLAKARARSL